jgi:hypothetical protein
MMQRIPITIAAGLAAAVLFIIPIKGTLLAMAIALFAPLPILIVALGFGHVTGLGAGLLGTVLIALLLHPLYGATFAATLALPCWWLAWLAQRSRPAQDASEAVIYYPLGRLLAWIAVIAGATALILIGAVEATFGSYAAAVQSLSAKLAPLLLDMFGQNGDLPGGLPVKSFAALVVLAMPPAMAAWSVVAFSLNLWLAGRVVLISQRLPRPWADVPANLRLPRLCLGVLVIALAGCLLPGLARLASASIAAAAAAAFALQGLAAIHAATRGARARAPLLSGLYALVFALMPWPLILSALVGIADALRPFRGRNPTDLPQLPPSTTTRRTPWK